jgi:hypothetical protein
MQLLRDKIPHAVPVDKRCVRINCVCTACLNSVRVLRCLCCVCVCVAGGGGGEVLQAGTTASSALPRNSFRGGVQQIQLRTERTGIWGR